MKIVKNDSQYTTRSLKSLLVWTWNRVQITLTPSQTKRADYAGAVVSIGNGRHSLNSHGVRIPKVVSDYHEVVANALAFWFYRAGIVDPWAAARRESGLDDAPRLAKAAPKKPRPKPDRDAQVAYIERAQRALSAKEMVVVRNEQALKKAKARVRLLERRISDAKDECKKLQRRFDKAVSEAADQPTDALSPKDFAARMRAKRQVEGAAPTAR